MNAVMASFYAKCDGWTEHRLQKDDEQPAAQAAAPTSPKPMALPVEPDQPYKKGDFIVARCDSKWYIGKILELDTEDGDAHIRFFTKSDKTCVRSFKWPLKPDELWVEYPDILMQIDSPCKREKWGCVGTPSPTLCMMS